MKILYKQSKENENNILKQYGINNCYFKKISFKGDSNIITKKTHHHNGFEIHIVIDGYQEYEINDKYYRLNSGDFMIIYPKTQHTFTASSPHMLKYAFTFDKITDMNLDFYSGKLTERVKNNLDFISDEAKNQKEMSPILIENNLLEILVLLFRSSGIKENENKISQNENAVITLAKQYIDDNIETQISVKNLAEYSHLSTKQFTRIFLAFEGISPGKYITNKRIKRIEQLLLQSELSLKQISERLCFSSEYYFNAFFKKYYGMSPGKYRKMYNV